MNLKSPARVGLSIALCLAMHSAAAFDLFGSLKGLLPGGSDASAEPAKPAAAGKAGEPAPVVDLSGVNASVLDGKAVSHIARAERIAVPSYRLGIVVRSGIRASADAGNVSMESSVELTGISEPQLRALADQALADFLDQLKASGRPIVPLEEIKAASGYAKVTPTPVPFAKKPFADARQIVMVSPTDLPLISTHFDAPLSDQGMMNLDNWRAINQLSVDLGAVILIPTVILDFAELTGSGHSVYSASASVSVKPGLYVVDVLSGLGGYHAKIALAGELGRARLKKRIAIGQAGEFVETSRVGNRAEVEWWNSMAVNQPNNAGRPSRAYESSTYQYRVDPALFDKTVLAGVMAVNRAYAELANTYKP